MEVQLLLNFTMKNRKSFSMQMKLEMSISVMIFMGNIICISGAFFPQGVNESIANIHLIRASFCCAGLSFAYQLLYLLDATGFYCAGLHALGIHVCRATGQELVFVYNYICI